MRAKTRKALQKRVKSVWISGMDRVLRYMRRPVQALWVGALIACGVVEGGAWAQEPVAQEPAQQSVQQPVQVRPQLRDEAVPHARWSHRAEARLWTRAALSALKAHGRPLVTMVPRDIAKWCPAYTTAGPDQRGAFWVGFMSALAKHESTYKPTAVGGGGKWYGLLQILPATARGYHCVARSGNALKHGPSNLSCAVRIMAVTVPRDGVIHGHDRKWRGVSADWGPMRSRAKRADMAGWLRRQSYCVPLSSIRPRPRPDGAGG